MKKIKKAAVNNFKRAVEATPHIATCYQPGLAALGRYKDKIEAGNPREIEGSIDIDEGVRTKYPQDNRWDYALSYKSEFFFVEVHAAQSSEVSVVLKKHRWLKDWLLTHAPELNRLKAKSKPAFYWIQSGSFQIPSHLPQYKQAINAGLKPVAKLKLT